MKAATSCLSALCAASFLAIMGPPTAAQGQFLTPSNAPPRPGLLPTTSGAVSPYDQATLRQILLNQEQAYFLQQQQANQQLVAQQQATADQQRQQYVNAGQKLKQGLSPSQAFAGLPQTPYYGAYPQQYGVGGGGFGGYPQYQGYQDPTAGSMPFQGQPMGGGLPQRVAPAVPFDQAQAMKAKAFQTPQPRAAAARAKAAKRKVATRKAAAPKKDLAEKPADAASDN